MTARRLLILGGTAEAAELARATITRFGEPLEVITSLAGRTQTPGPLPGRVRIGGFGGPRRLAAYLALVGRIGRRVWLTIGAGEIARFAAVSGVHFLVRVIDPPGRLIPLRSYELVVGRGPFTLSEERDLLGRHAIDLLVCKASGGAATEPKLIAARELGLPVVMVRRPAAEPGESVETVEAALNWLAGPSRFPEARRVS